MSISIIFIPLLFHLFIEKKKPKKKKKTIKKKNKKIQKFFKRQNQLRLKASKI